MLHGSRFHARASPNKDKTAKRLHNVADPKKRSNAPFTL
jgi:hypothetical protein